MTTQEILSLARLKLLEAGTEIVSDSTLLLYANLAHKDVIKSAFPNSAVTEATISFTNGVGSLPALFGTLYTDAYDSNNNIFPEVSISDFIRNNANAIRSVVIEGGQIKVSPNSTSSLTIKYWPTYATLTTSVNPSIDEFLHEPIVYGILGRAFEDLQDWELSQFHYNKFKQMLEDRLNILNNYELEAQRGGEMFNGISIISDGVNNNPDRW